MQRLQQLAYSRTLQVVDGGNLDIDYSVMNTQGLKPYNEKQKHDGVFQDNAATTGRYEFCLSNKFSTMTGKNVFFMITVAGSKTITGIEGDGTLEYIAVSCNRSYSNNVIHSFIKSLPPSLTLTCLINTSLMHLWCH